MLGDALHTYILSICFAIKFKWLIVLGAELGLFADLLFLTSQLESNVVFGELVGFDLGIVFVSAGGAIKESFFFVDYEEALFADGVTAVEIPGYFGVGVVEVEAHWTFHALM